MTILVSGGSGFIGSAVVRHLVLDQGEDVVNVDKLTYSGSAMTNSTVETDPRYAFEQADISDAAAINDIFARYRPSAVIHTAAETHVDRSIDRPEEFVQTNVLGTFTLLEAARHHLASHPTEGFRFVHVSTDEVFGTLGTEGMFSETSPYRPNSPYSATKAASDHLARAWFHTFGVPTIITNCSNNFGPYQYPEKLIPLMVLNALRGRPLPVYGTGQNVRDWLFVDDHARALVTVLRHGQVGETYTIGSNTERTNVQIVEEICAILDRLRPDAPHAPHSSLIDFVADRPGHDLRYAIDATRIRNELGWAPTRSFSDALEETIAWYLDNEEWCAAALGDDLAIERQGIA